MTARLPPWAAVAFGVALVALDASWAQAAAPESFAEAASTAMSPVEIAQGGTIAAHPAVTFDNQLDDLLDGTAAAVAKLCEMITSAQDEILVQVYQWDDNDAAAREVVTALRARVERALSEPRLTGPLMIHIVVNGTLPAESVTSHMALIALVRGVAAVPGGRDHVQFELAMHGGFALAVLHSKSAMFDGRQDLIMTGNLRTRGGIEDDFYNAGLTVSGPMVAALRDDWRDARARSTPYVSSVPAMSTPGPSTPRPAGARDPIAAAVLTKQAAWFPMLGDANPQARGMLALIDTSTDTIEAMNPALNAPAIARALTRAALRGVDVSLVLSLNMDRWEQHTFFGGDNAEVVYGMYDALLATGGRPAANRLHVFWPSGDGNRPASEDDAVNVHAKAAMFDRGCLWLGSMNWDTLSWWTSRELSVAMFADYTNLWQARMYTHVRRASVPVRASDLPHWAQNCGNRVYVYLQSRESP